MSIRSSDDGAEVVGDRPRADTTGYMGTPISDLKEFRLKGYTFTQPDTITLGVIPAPSMTGGDSIAVDAEILPGTMGVLFVTAVDLSGNESCVCGNHVFALPAIDPMAAKVIDAAGYDIVWRKPW